MDNCKIAMEIAMDGDKISLIAYCEKALRNTLER